MSPHTHWQQQQPFHVSSPSSVDYPSQQSRLPQQQHYHSQHHQGATSSTLSQSPQQVSLMGSSMPPGDRNFGRGSVGGGRHQLHNVTYNTSSQQQSQMSQQQQFQHSSLSSSHNSPQDGTSPGTVTTPNSSVQSNSSSSPASNSNNSSKTNKPTLKRKRVAVSKACYHCRRAHAKCSDTRPCTRCVRRGVACVENEEDLGEKAPTTNDSKSDARRGLPFSAVPSLSQMIAGGHSPSMANGRYLTNEPQQIDKVYPPHSLAPRTAPYVTFQQQSHGVPNQPTMAQHGQQQSTLPTTSPLPVPTGYPTFGPQRQQQQTSFSLDMVSSLTQAITQQAQLIEQLVAKHKDQSHPSSSSYISQQPQETQPRERILFQTNPFVQHFGQPDEACCIWKNHTETHAFTVLFASDAFCRIFNSTLSELQGATMTVDDLPSIILGTYGQETPAPHTQDQKKMEAYIGHILQNIPNRDQNMRKQFSERIYYMKRRLVLSMKFYEATMERKNGVTYAHYKRVEEFNDEIFVNAEHLQKTFETKDLGDVTGDVIHRSVKRIAQTLDAMAGLNCERDSYTSGDSCDSSNAGDAITTTTTDNGTNMGNNMNLAGGSSTPTSKSSPLVVSKGNDTPSFSPFLSTRSGEDPGLSTMQLDEQLGLDDFDFFLV
eukprot:CAMPEP_0117443232 /NCGR_PEP_ID=MMETSP0759-20121206/4585_1 /TAXON_ID=63605 /ORGANISM="Percolomonas cosmopolitus, Strain WS" /LENGTH=654 /DNA_ID=CAMNT_0005235193 /DNA_START=273 /DNA_END=2237 /DNA_ORIENTATION=+